MPTPTQEQTSIAGPCGAIETLIDRVDSDRWAILCHPHPLYGGNMHDAVLATATGVLTAAGENCVRFNFRGTGASEGEHDNGQGEVHDFIAVYEWVVATQTPAAVIAGGYSFGSIIAGRASATCGQVSKLILIAPPTRGMTLSDEIACPTIAIAGTHDDFIDLAALESLHDANAHFSIVHIEGADHFFSGHHQALAQALQDA